MRTELVSAFKSLLTMPPFVGAYARYLRTSPVSSQSDEVDILARLAAERHIPNSFVEFGFHPREYNCAALHGFRGLLIDGCPSTARLAKAMLPRSIRIERRFLNLDNLSLITDFCRDSPLGVLSVDVDGNDYWFIRELLPLVQPSILVAEYNASFGLKPVTVPYDPKFDRHVAHPSGWYHGASLTALESLCSGFGYGLFTVSEGGGNAFFIRGENGLPVAPLYRENAMRNKWSGTRASEQWDLIRHLPLASAIKHSDTHRSR